MRVLDFGSQGDHVQAGKLFADQPAFEPGVNGDDLGLLACDLGMDRLHGLEQGRLQVGPPAGIAFGLFDLGRGQVRDGLDDVAQGFQGRSDRAAAGTQDGGLVFERAQNGQVGRSFDQAGDLGVHGRDAVGAAEQEIEKGFLALGGQGNVFFAGLDGVQGEFQVGFDDFIFGPDLVARVLQE